MVDGSFPSPKQVYRPGRAAGETEHNAKPIDKHVGSRARMRRMMLGMFQTILAGAVGVSFQQVQKYEKGTNRISASIFLIFCKSRSCSSSKERRRFRDSTMPTLTFRLHNT
jgi:DNA-binding XRE family transcriptional regulator